ncbi:MAG TPA: hypothetical protein VMZ28_29265 [Kofleriaceae bacterium]|nr:hypothetical protein [Kofleriaceae bacterium]
MAPPQGQKGYKRSWKNLLLNKRYQLRFTLTMVGFSAALMVLLGVWVMNVANRSTTVAINNVLGEEICKDPVGDDAPPPADDAPPKADDHKPVVTIEETSMELLPEAPKPEGAEGATPAPAPEPEPEAEPVKEPATAPTAASMEECRARQAAKIEDLKARNWLIFWVLVASGTVLVLGLLVYGIKMTHKVAGPLHKVSLYMGKLQEGRYDTVYNLRKGDQLVSFYDHFKQAHAGLKRWQVDDIARLKTLIAAADQAKLAGRSPEAAEALEELRALLEKKEKSLS